LICDVVVVGGSVLVEEGVIFDGSLNVMLGSVWILGMVIGDVFGRFVFGMVLDVRRR
jgi:hypothetical protein